MKTRIGVILVLWLCGCAAAAERPFFAFCMDTHDTKKRDVKQQTEMLKQLGYAGCGHLWLKGLEQRVEAMKGSGLKLFQVYLKIDLKKAKPIDEEQLKKVLPLLKPHKTQLALLVGGGKRSDPSLDEKAVKIIGRIADLAEPHGVSIVLYPHTNDWLEKCSDGVRVAKKINRPGVVGVMFNLCHWMKRDDNRDLDAVLKQAKPWLMAVSISGSDKPEEVRKGKGNWIQPLGEGSYEIGQFLKALDKIEYKGAVGLQCYGLRGDAAVHLEKSIKAWRSLPR